MGNTFSKVFLPIFGVLVVGIIAIVIWPKLPKRHKPNSYLNDSTELSYLATNSANINRLSAPFPPHPAVRVFDGPPHSALSARRREVLSRDLENPFVDPPTHNQSSDSFQTVLTAARSDYSLRNARPVLDKDAESRNFSTPTRRNRFPTFNRNVTQPGQPVYSIAPPQFSSSPEIQVPERAYMTAVKPAGRAPPLGPQPARFPMPSSRTSLPASSSSHRHLHPNKLFENISRQNTPSYKSTITTIEESSPQLPPAPIPPLLQRHTITPSKSDASFVTTSSPISPILSESFPARLRATEHAQQPNLPRLALASNSNPNITIKPPSACTTSLRTDLPIRHEITTNAKPPPTTGALTPVSTIREFFNHNQDATTATAMLPQSSTAGSSLAGQGTVTVASASASPPSSPAIGFSSPRPVIVRKRVPAPLNLTPPAAAPQRASSIYSRDEAGEPVVGGVGKPAGRAPGGAEWI